MSDLERLASLAGIADRFTDVWGETHRVSDATRGALLTAMGFALDDPAAEAAALEARDWRATLPPACVLEADRGGSIGLALPTTTEALDWTLTPEKGVPARGSVDWTELTRQDGIERDGEAIERRALPLPPLAAGYYTLSVVAGERAATSLLIVAPDRCWLPAALRQRDGAVEGRIWGISVQLYGLRSDRNWGIGDFTDLADLARGVAALGVQAIGLNPLHALFPEAPGRFAPYAPSSRLFLNPLYLDVSRIDGFADWEPAQAAFAEAGFQARLRAARDAELVDYPAVAALKRPILEILFRRFQRLGDQPALAAFRTLHGTALERHALFEALSEHFAREGLDWWGAWPEAFHDPASPAAADFAATHADRIAFFAWLQWQTDRQLADAHAAARQAGMSIGLYRDLAVGSDSAGAETWVDPARFARGVAIGAPPDLYNPHGQNWGLPPLSPPRLRESAYRPFIELVRANMARAGALRIDHAFALARLYWIPAGRSPREGAYVAYPLAILLAILRLESQRNRCLVIGEDLGTGPAGFQDELARSGILSYRLLYFERDAEGSFKPPESWPALALAAASTHDLPTLAGWWHGGDITLRADLALYPDPALLEQDRAARPRDRERLRGALAAQGLDAGGDAPPIEAVQRWLARSRAALLIVQVEDALGLAEQANLPGTTDQHPNWRRKLPVPLDALVARDGALARLAPVIEAERPRPAERFGALAWPAATYRVQLHAGFTLHDAAAIVPYLAALGITHLYASPYFTARPQSHHGYDIVDHGSINPELGGEAGLQALTDALAGHGMGHIVDFVPNHMGIGGSDNGWWLDVLEWGEASPYADYFDIDWRPRFDTGGGKLLLPILGEHYGTILRRGELKLAFDAAAGSFSVWYFAHRLPVCPVDYPLVLDVALAMAAERDPNDQAAVELGGLIGDLRALDRAEAARRADRPADALKLRLARLAERSTALADAIAAAVTLINGLPDRPASFGLLHRLMEAQSWRVAFWRVAGEINYRRFFDINDLAGLRMENRALFDHAHRLVFDLIDGGRLQGLRIDHIDGLADPAQYCRRLQDHAGPDLYVVVEKILAAHETLRPDWPVAGTTGYDVLNQINGVLVDAAGERGLDRAYRRFAGIPDGLDEILRRAKLQILEQSLSSERQVLALAIKRIADADPETRDYTFDALRQALSEVIAWFPVYRTYVTPMQITADDRQHIDAAVNRAQRHSQLADRSIYDFLRSVLTLERRGGAAIPEFVRKFQQLTGPVMAKGLEDTSFYRYVRLLSLNEVGGDPRRFGLSLAAFHHLNERRLAAWPRTLVATATHDTKRGEDVRARLDTLSEMPAAWSARILRWSRLNRLKRRVVDDRPAPTRNDEYLIYQTLVGSWPLALRDAVEPGQALDDYVGRLCGFLEKALREAKENTSWTQPDTAYEAAALGFARRILDARRPSLFLADFLPFQQRVALLGMVNGLTQLILKLTIPGVPDIYQGTELWDLSLVDPDNRRPVDYAGRGAALAGDTPVETLLAAWPDGRIKQRLLATLLRHRRDHRALYDAGAYRPLKADGTRADHALAFERRRDAAALLVVVPVLTARLTDGASLPTAAALWQDTTLPLERGEWRDLFTGARHHADGAPVRLAALLDRLPVACLERVG